MYWNSCLTLVYNHAGGGFDPNSLFFYDFEQRIVVDSNGNLDNNYSLYFMNQPWAGGLMFVFRNAWIAQFLIDNARFFLNEYRIDGIRYDEVRVISNNGGYAVCQHLTDTVRATNRSALQIAEYWNDDRPNALNSVPDGGLGFDSELGDGLRDGLRELLGQAAGGESASIYWDKTASNLVTPQAFSAGWRLVQQLESQDKVYAGHGDAARVAWLADPLGPSGYSSGRSRVATSLLLAAPGIPSLFMGEEFLEDKLWSDDLQYRDSRGFASLIWWQGALGADKSRADFLAFSKDMIHLRRSEPALRSD